MDLYFSFNSRNDQLNSVSRFIAYHKIYTVSFTLSGNQNEELDSYRTLAGQLFMLEW